MNEPEVTEVKEECKPLPTTGFGLIYATRTTIGHAELLAFSGLVGLSFGSLRDGLLVGLGLLLCGVFH